jgi:hypothetical protein
MAEEIGPTCWMVFIVLVALIESSSEGPKQDKIFFYFTIFSAFAGITAITHH